MKKLFLLTIFSLLFIAFSGTCTYEKNALALLENDGNLTLDENLYVLDYALTQEERTLAVTGGEVEDDGTKWGSFTPDEGTESSFKGMVRRIVSKAQLIDDKKTFEQCVNSGRNPWSFCTVDCYRDFPETKCDNKIVRAFKIYIPENINEEYCVNPRIALLGPNPTPEQIRKCNTRPCPCTTYKDIVTSESIIEQGKEVDGRTLQARMYARIVAYRGMCQKWCATGVKPIRTFKRYKKSKSQDEEEEENEDEEEQEDE
jgi:hypothetical protein